MTALASSAKAIQKAMGQVATENQAHLGSPPAYRTPHKGPLAQKVTFNWAGPVVPAVRLLAKMAGYHFQTVGQAPAKPVTVSVRESEMPLFDALQDIGWEAGTHVGVVVDQTNKIVQLVYHGQGNS